LLKLDYVEKAFVLDTLQELVLEDARTDFERDKGEGFWRTRYTTWKPKTRKRARSRRD
jgi:hypothetical protein